MNVLLEILHATPAGPLRFREFAPSGFLRPYIACFWTSAGSAPGRRTHRVLPDGCADFIFNLHPRAPNAVVIGPMTGSREVISDGTADLGVRFYPGIAPLFLGHPLTDLQERVVPLAAFWGRTVDRLLDQLLAEPSLARRVAALEVRLAERLRQPIAGDPRVIQAIKWIYAEQGRLQVRDVARKVGLCERQLRRKFPDWTGYTPKVFVRVMRFQHALETLLRAPAVGDANVAALHGYSDQSHMIHEFCALGGRPPRTFHQAVRGVGSECPIFSIPTPGTLRYDRVR